MLDNKLNSKLDYLYNIINNIINEVTKLYIDSPINDTVLYNIKTTIRNTLASLLHEEVSNVDIEVYNDGGIIRIRPLNLFTGLLLLGYYVPIHILNNHSEWETDKFIMKYVEGQVTIYPKPKIEYVTVNMDKELEE